MIQRIALLVGGLGAAAVLAFALGLGNFVFAQPAANPPADMESAAAQLADTNMAAEQGSSNDQAARSEGAQEQTRTVVDKVYIAPAAPPKVIHVNKPSATTEPTTAPASQPEAPAASPASHDDGGYDNDHEPHESERSAERGHEREDD